MLKELKEVKMTRKWLFDENPVRAFVSGFVFMPIFVISFEFLKDGSDALDRLNRNKLLLATLDMVGSLCLYYRAKRLIKPIS